MRRNYLAFKFIPRIAAGLLLSLALAPAHAAGDGLTGLWCGTGPLHMYSVAIAQRSPKEMHGTVSRRQRRWEVRGWLEGSVLRTESTRIGALMLEVIAGELRVTGGDGPVEVLKGQVFTRASGAACAG